MTKLGSILNDHLIDILIQQLKIVGIVLLFYAYKFSKHTG